MFGLNEEEVKEIVRKNLHVFAEGIGIWWGDNANVSFVEGGSDTALGRTKEEIKQLYEMVKQLGEKQGLEWKKDTEGSWVRKDKAK